MNELRDDLKAYLDGELPETRAAELAAALASDPVLQKEAELIGAIGEGIRSLAAEPNVQGFERTLAAVTRRSRSPWRTVLGFALAAGTTVIVAAIIFPVFAQSKSSAKLVLYDRGIAQSPAFRNESEQRGRAAADGFATAPEEAPAASPMPGRGGAGFEGVTNGSSDLAEAPGTVLPPTVEPRLVIQNADIALRVDDAAHAQAQTMAMAKGLGGYVENSSVSFQQRGLPVADVTVRVPAKSFEVALERIRSIDGSAELLNESLSGDDVTAQVADVEARLKVLRGEEDQYLEILKATRKIGEVLAVKERLSMVRQQIESYDAQRKVLRDQASLSTIHAMFEQRVKVGEPEGPQNWAGDTWSNSVNALQVVGTALAQAAIALFVFAPIWLPLVLIAWWIARRLR